MKLDFSLEDLTKILDNKAVEGAFAGRLTGIATLTDAKDGDISFLGNKKYIRQVPESKASVILVPEDYSGTPSATQAYIKVDNASVALSKICAFIERALWPKREAGIHPSAVVEPSAKVSTKAFVGPLCYVGENAVIGDNTTLVANVYVGKGVKVGESCLIKPQAAIYDYCQLGNSVCIESGAVIGSDGYGYETRDGRHVKDPQVGRVVLEDFVDVGANTTIDRARFSETRIGEGTKIDNLVQIAHNVKVGKHCLIVSQTGISGSTVLEDYVILAGQVGLTGHIKIGKGAIIGAQSGINNDVEPGAYLRGSPPFPYNEAMRLEIYKKRLPELFKRVNSLEEHLNLDSKNVKR